MPPRQLLLLLLSATQASALPPQLGPDSVRLHPGHSALLRVLENDAGDPDPTTVEIVSPPTHGTAVPDGAGRILYRHQAGGSAADSFSYRASGPGGWSEPVPVTVQIAEGLRVPPAGINVPTTPPPNRYRVVPAFGGMSFQRSTTIASAPGDAKRLFVCEAAGKIRLIPDVAAAAPTSSLFMDLPAILAPRQGESIDIGAWQEHGLLGLAFHPRHAENGHLFVFYTVKKAGLYSQRLSRFTVRADDKNSVDPASERILIEQPDRELNHNGGDLHFGADGYLYFSAGDEGPQFDSRGNSQRIDLNFFSGIFRIDVDCLEENLLPNAHTSIPTDDGVAHYRIPADNPYVGASSFNGLPVDPAQVRAEFWATGFRSPWRFSFDHATGELWCGDVGQEQYEEVNLVTRGGNYGWAYRDGLHSGFRQPPAGSTGVLTDPLYEYVHPAYPGDPAYKGNSVIGGLVYHGSRFGELEGAYLFGDWGSGNIWSLRRAGGEVNVERLTGLPGVAGFGTDPSNGDLLLLVNSYGTAPLYRLAGGDPAEDYPLTLGATGLFADLAALSPNPGLLPYEPNVSFWSDHALKRRWFALPDASSTIGWKEDAPWEFPAGTLWVKHFDLEMVRGNPASKRRIETRVLVQDAEGVHGVSYRWNDAQTDAELVPQEGAEIPLSIQVDGVPQAQVWQIPSRSDCRTCHNAAAGGALSFNTRQLNREQDIHGFSGNLLTLLGQGGFFSTPPASPNLLPRHASADNESYSVETRVRSYLEVNCSYCHQPGGGAPPSWDGRGHLKLADTGLLNGVPIRDGGDSSRRLVLAGQADKSILLHRLAGSAGFSRMPPLGSRQEDGAAVALLTRWIAEDLPGRQDYAAWRALHFGLAAEGAPDADPDGDGLANDAEFLLGLPPLQAGRPPLPALKLMADEVSLSFDLAPNRTFRVWRSPDLSTWSEWDVPGNDGRGRLPGPVSITAPREQAKGFFKLEISEP